MKDKVLEFLKREKLVTLATLDEEGKPWVSNMFFGVDSDLNMYFVSKRGTNHSKQLEANEEVAFTVSHFNWEEENEKVAIQAKGTAKLLTNVEEIKVGGEVIFEKFTDWPIDAQEMLKKIDTSGMYKITPTYMKYWNDELEPKTVEIDLKS